MDENTKDEGKEDLAREEDGGNILDDILNTKEEKFEDEDMVKKDEEEDDDNDLDLGDEDSPGGREENSRKGPESDFSDSEDEESKAILRDGRDSEMSFNVVRKSGPLGGARPPRPSGRGTLSTVPPPQYSTFFVPLKS